MTEAVTFWLDNKVSSGVKMAEMGDQTLVCYREKFYVVEQGAARMRGSKTLHYTKSSLPAAWKKAMGGNPPPTAPSPPAEDAPLPRATTGSRNHPTMEKTATPHPPQPEESPAETEPCTPPATAPVPAKKKSKTATARGATKRDTEIQEMIAAACPYCNHKNDLPLEKGKNGKPFFTACGRCGREFAVRFVPVTVYQAQVAAFK